MKHPCQCGCGLMLSREDIRRTEKVKPEPMTAGICRGCGVRLEIATYLIDFLNLRNAPWPECDTCRTP